MSGVVRCKENDLPVQQSMPHAADQSIPACCHSHSAAFSAALPPSGPATGQDLGSFRQTTEQLCDVSPKETIDLWSAKQDLAHTKGKPSEVSSGRSWLVVELKSSFLLQLPAARPS